VHDPLFGELLLFEIIVIPRKITMILVGQTPYVVFVIAFLAFVYTHDAFVALRGAITAGWIRIAPDDKLMMALTGGASPGAPCISEHTICAAVALLAILVSHQN
jgi:hypothetical protein